MSDLSDSTRVARQPVPACLLLACAALFVAGIATADQYRSETRELEATPPKAKEVDTARLLESTTDPYARSMLLRDLASRAVTGRNYDDAAKYLEQAIAQNGLSGIAQEQMRKDLAELYVASGKPESVIKALEPKVKNDPRADPGLQVALAAAYLEFKRYKEALPLLQRAVAANPKPDESWLQALYAALIGVGQEKAALPVLERLLHINPSRREYWMQLAGLYYKANDREKALNLLELASRQGFLETGDERLQLVSLTAEQGAPYEAASLMQLWMEQGQLPKTAQNWEALAGFWIEAREYTPAIEALRAVIREAPRPELYLQLGQLHMERQEFLEAAVALAQGVPTNVSKLPPVLLTLGTASFYSGNVEGAREAFSGALRFPGSAKSAQEWLTFLDTEAAQQESARLALQKYAPDNQTVSLSRRLQGEPVRISAALAAAGDTPEQRRVGGRQTEVGAEADGNADGSIPEWTGGIQKPPAGYKPGGPLVDPFPDDKPLFTISAANAAKYATRLSTGHKMLMSLYPDYRMPVYTTRRSAAYPQSIYEATQVNIGKARLIGSDALSGARLGFPFPRPQNGVEVMWNHRTRYRGDSFEGVTSQAVVSQTGISSENKGVFRVLFRYGNIKNPGDIDDENILVYGITWFGKSPMLADFVVLFHETANSIKKARGIWALISRVGKMLRIPPVGYDQPLYGSEGLYFIDMIDMYNGAFDRYVWKLTGKRELYIPYNGYRLVDGSSKYKEQLKYPFLNPDTARYELHRVWVVEATERGGKTHAFGKRVFYVDEDSWNVVLVENYDRKGNPWRFQEGHLITSYEVQSSNTFPIITYDLKEKRYFAQRLLAEDPPLKFNLTDIRDQEFLPAAVKRTYSR